MFWEWGCGLVIYSLFTVTSVGTCCLCPFDSCVSVCELTCTCMYMYNCILYIAYVYVCTCVCVCTILADLILVV